jgi:hypothetical protein
LKPLLRGSCGIDVCQRFLLAHSVPAAWSLDPLDQLSTSLARRHPPVAVLLSALLMGRYPSTRKAGC